MRVDDYSFFNIDCRNFIGICDAAKIDYKKLVHNVKTSKLLTKERFKKYKVQRKVKDLMTKEEDYLDAWSI